MAHDPDSSNADSSIVAILLGLGIQAAPSRRAGRRNPRDGGEPRSCLVGAATGYFTYALDMVRYL